MPTSGDIVRLLEEYGVIPLPLARASLVRLDSESPPSLATLLAEFHEAGRISEFLKNALEQGQVNEVQVGDHLLLAPIGRGGMGMVYRARSRVMQRDVAIKLMRSDLPKDDSVLKRFLQEVRTAGELAHPHIVSAYHAGRHGDGYYLTMELVHGDTLDRIVRERGPLGLREALQLAIQVCEGLDYAHRHGFVHRDIKPSNLLLNEQRQVKILDLGLSRRIAGEPAENAVEGSPAEPVERLTESGSFMGTTIYMSPEQAEEPQTADHRADMYSLGCTLFVIMTGRPPYKDPSPVKVVLAHREAPIPSVRELREDATPQIDSLFRRLLAKKPDQRPDSYAEVIRDLRGCLESLKAPTLGPEEVDANADTMVLPPSALDGKSSSRGLYWIMALIALLLLSVAAWELGPWDLKPQNRLSLVPVDGRQPAESAQSGAPQQPERALHPVMSPWPMAVDEDRQPFEFSMPPIDREGTLRLTVSREPGTDQKKAGPFIVSLPIGEGRIHFSMDRRNDNGQGEYFVGFLESDKVAERFFSDFALDETPKTITIVIRPTGIKVMHEETVVLSWQGDPRHLRTGQSWRGGPKPYFSCNNSGQFNVISAEWTGQKQELESQPSKDLADD